MKKTVKLMLASTALLSLAACVNPSQANKQAEQTQVQKQASKKVNFGYNQLPANLDPAAEYNGWFSVRFGVTETLFKLTDTLGVEPWLAKSIEQVSPLEWKVTLKPNITFQNGVKLTGEKVKLSLEKLLKDNERAAADMNVESISASEDTVVIKTKQEMAMMANLLTEPYTSIVDTQAESKVKQAVVGTGPYQVTDFVTESGVTLKAYDQYWQGKPKTADLQIKYFSDANALSLALQAKEIDAAYGLPYANLATFQSNKDYTVSEVEGTRDLAFIYNFSKPLMADATFRQAIDTLVDKETYTKSLFKGSAQVANSAFPNRLSFAIQSSVHEFNVEKAKQLLDQAGYKDTNGNNIREKDGKDIQLELLSYTRLAEIPLAMQALQQQLKDVGIDATIKSVEKISPALKENTYDISPYTMVTAPIGDPYAYFKSSVVSDGVVNVGHYKNAEVDTKVNTLVTTSDTMKRDELSKEIETILDRDYAFTYIGHFKVALVMHGNVKGLTSHPTDYYHVTNQLEKE